MTTDFLTALKGVFRTDDGSLAKLQFTPQNGVLALDLPPEGIPLSSINDLFTKALGRATLLQQLPDAFWKELAQDSPFAALRLVRLELAGADATKVDGTTTSFYLGLAWDTATYTLLDDGAGTALITLEAIDLGLGVIGSGQIQQAQLFADFSFGGVDCSVFVSLPDRSFEARIKSGRSYPLRPLLQQVGIDSGLFGDIDLTYLAIQGDSEQKELRIDLLIEDVAHPAEWLSITAIELSLARRFDASKYLAATLACDATFFNLPVTLSASYLTGDGWTFTGQTLPEAEIHLSDLVSRLLAACNITLPSAVPQILLEYLQVSFNPSSRLFTLNAEAKADSPSTIAIGDGSYEVRPSINITVSRDPRSGKRVFEGLLRADLHYSDAEKDYLFSLQFVLGQESHVLEGSWASVNNESLHISTLLKLLRIDGVLDDLGLGSVDIDTSLTAVAFAYDLDTQMFRLNATSKVLGSAFFVARKGGQSPHWSVVFGLVKNGVGKLSNIPGLGSYVPGDGDFVQLKSAAILFSNVSGQSFLLPALPSLDGSVPLVRPTVDNNAQKTVTPIASIEQRQQFSMDAQPLELKKGFAALAVIDMVSSGSGNVLMKNLHSLAATDELAIEVLVDTSTKSLMLHGALAGSVAIQTGKGSALQLHNPVIDITIGALSSVSLGGDFKLVIDRTTMDVTVAISISELAALVRCTVAMEGPKGVALPAPEPLSGLHLTEIGLEMGLYFAPPALDLGIQGSAYIGSNTAHTMQFAFVLQMVEEVPNPLLLAFDANSLKPSDALTIVTDKDETNALLDWVAFDDVSLHWADEPVILPDGTNVSPGFSFHTGVRVAGFSAYGRLQSDLNGLQGFAEIAPIHLPTNNPVLSITGQGKGVTIKQQLVNNTWQNILNSSALDPSNQMAQKGLTATGTDDKKSAVMHYSPPTPPQERIATLVAAGGPVIQLNGKSSPFVHANGRVSLFNALSAEITIDIASDMFRFKYHEQAGTVYNRAFDCTLRRSGDIFSFAADGSFNLHLEGDIGPIIPDLDITTIHLDAELAASASIKITNSDFLMKIDGSFSFEGKTLTLPHIEINIPFGEFDHLAKVIWQKIVDEAEEIFADLLKDVLALWNDAKKFAEDTYKAAQAAAKKIGEEAAVAAHAIEDEARKVAHAVDETAEKVAKAAQDAEDEAKQLVSDAGKAAAEVIGEADKALNQAIDEGKKLLSDAEDTVKAVKDALKHDLDAIGSEIKDIAADAEKEATKILDDAAAVASKALDEAKQWAEDTLKEADRLASKIGDEAKQIWNDVTDLAKKAEEKIEEAAHWAEHAASKAWHVISHY
jgi:hypothetical protein